MTVLWHNVIILLCIPLSLYLSLFLSHLLSFFSLSLSLSLSSLSLSFLSRLLLSSWSLSISLFHLYVSFCLCMSLCLFVCVRVCVRVRPPTCRFLSFLELCFFLSHSLSRSINHSPRNIYLWNGHSISLILHIYQNSVHYYSPTPQIIQPYPKLDGLPGFARRPKRKTNQEF